MENWIANLQGCGDGFALHPHTAGPGEGKLVAGQPLGSILYFKPLSPWKYTVIMMIQNDDKCSLIIASTGKFEGIA